MMMTGMMTTTKTKTIQPQHVAQAALPQEQDHLALLQELVQAAQDHQVHLRKRKRKKIQVGWLNIE
jgi:hypothetical protein